MANVTTFQPAGFHFGATVQSLVSKVKTNVARKAEYNRVFRELSVLDNRELNDIGISRGEIHDVAKTASNMI